MSRDLLVAECASHGLRMRIYIPQKITVTVKNRLHSRQQPCRLRGELRAPPSLQVARGTSRSALVASAAADRDREALIKARSAYNQRFLLFLISLEFITSLITKQKISE